MRKIVSADLPQADRIESVLLATMAVKNGARTDIEIANSVPGIEGDSRQGRYYRYAAEMLGFVQNHRNHATITAKGMDLLANATIRNPLFVSSVMHLPIYQKLLPYLELHPEGQTRQEILSYLQSISDPEMGRTMMPRRISTILAWPRSLGLIVDSVDGLFKLVRSSQLELPPLQIQDIDQPLLPRTASLSEFQEIERRTTSADRAITAFKDLVKTERADNAHRDLVNLVSKRIRATGAVPKSNQLIDLAASLEHDYIFEMKSTTSSNEKSQIRTGLSQLYEYRYLQNKPDAKLVLVIENPLSENERWRQDYLEHDRDVYLVWDGNNELYGNERTRNDLEFLGVLP